MDTIHTAEKAVEADLVEPAPKGVAIVDARQAPSPAEGTPLLATIYRAATDPHVDINKFERLLAMQEKLENAQARRDFDAAIAMAKAEIGPILKNREVDFTTAKGRTNYRYEDFAAVAKAVDVPLGRHGVSYRFRSEQEGKGGDADPRRVRITCVLSKGGYSEETSLVAFEDHSGNKNSIQAISSTATYLQRATLKLALGLAAGVDDDGKTLGQDAPTGLTDEQIAELRGLIVEANSDPKTIPKFESDMLAYVKAESIEDMTPAQFAKAAAAIRKQIAAEQKKGRAA